MKPLHTGNGGVDGRLRRTGTRCLMSFKFSRFHGHTLCQSRNSNANLLLLHPCSASPVHNPCKAILAAAHSLLIKTQPIAARARAPPPPLTSAQRPSSRRRWCLHTLTSSSPPPSKRAQPSLAVRAPPPLPSLNLEPSHAKRLFQACVIAATPCWQCRMQL